MKTALDYVNERGSMDFASSGTMGATSTGIDGIPFVRRRAVANLMKEYATQIIEEVLKRAAENAEVKEIIAYSGSREIVEKVAKSITVSAAGILKTTSVDKLTILNTEYKDLIK